MSGIHLKSTDDSRLQFVTSDGKIVLEIGISDADSDQSYIATSRADGTLAYTTVDTGTTLDTTASKP